MDSADKPRARFPRPAKRGEGGTQRAQRDAGPRKRGEGNALLPFARPELEAEVERWLEYLGAERRYSPKTLEAYARDARQLLAFLAGHLGQKLTLTDLAKLEPRDVRAFLAARRAEGLTSRSLMRALAGARSFARYLERHGKGAIGALSAVRSPKLPKTLPKPLTVNAAKRIVETELRAGEDREPWILARDAAVLALLYGSGLRISEALGLAIFAGAQLGFHDALGGVDGQRLGQQDPHGPGV